MFFFDHPLPPASALVSLVDSPCGFCPVDVGINQEDLLIFDAIAIAKTQYYNQFGEFSKTEREVAAFLSEIGPNESELVQQVARRINNIVHQIMAVSGKETAWVCLRASIPNDKAENYLWHMDGHYYSSPKEEIQYKFGLTLIGPSTLFYPIPQADKEQRRDFWSNMTHRQYIRELCPLENVIASERGTGMFFMSADKFRAAVHCEPPIDRPRLFFSIVPCSEPQLAELKEKVLARYTKPR